MNQGKNRGVDDKVIKKNGKNGGVGDKVIWTKN